MVSCPYPRPRGATPFRVPLTPAYQECTSPNRTHGPPLSDGSCAPPQQTSAHLTIGTPDANGQGASSVGNVVYVVSSGDVEVSASVSDVREQGTLADYTGELSVEQAVQLTDRSNGPSGDEPATVQASPFRFAVPCTATVSTTTGSSCSLTSSFNSILPGSVVAGRRAIWELGEIDVFDGGTDGQAGTAGDNTLFERQGLFVP
jgi:hypothetical protein